MRTFLLVVRVPRAWLSVPVSSPGSLPSGHVLSSHSLGLPSMNHPVNALRLSRLLPCCTIFSRIDNLLSLSTCSLSRAFRSKLVFKNEGWIFILHESLNVVSQESWRKLGVIRKNVTTFSLLGLIMLLLLNLTCCLVSPFLFFFQQGCDTNYKVISMFSTFLFKIKN